MSGRNVNEPGWWPVTIWWRHCSPACQGNCHVPTCVLLPDYMESVPLKEAASS
jgi:hypothetical protein